LFGVGGRIFLVNNFLTGHINLSDSSKIDHNLF